MSLEVYPTDFHTRYEISHAISILVSVYYDDVGKMTVVVPISDYNIMALKNGCIVYDTDRENVYIIQNVKTDTDLNRITAYGFTAEWIIDKRALIEKRTINNVEQDVYSAIRDNLRGLSMIRLAPAKGLQENADGDVMEEGQLLSKTSSVLHQAGLGRRAIWDDTKKQIVYEIYKGVDRTKGIYSVTFSDEQGTAKDLIINDDVSNWKNVAYITVDFKDDHTEVISVGKADGNNRREIWSKRKIMQGYKETAEETRKRAKSEAALELARNIKRRNFSVSVDPKELGVMYKLGDLVSCVSIKFGMQFTARVSGVKYKMDITGEKTEVILGTPKLTSIGGLALEY